MEDISHGIVWRGKGTVRQILPKTHYTKDEEYTKSITIPVQPLPGLTKTMPSASHQGRGERYVTEETTICGRELTNITTWNVRMLAQTGKLQELMYELEEIYMVHSRSM